MYIVSIVWRGWCGTLKRVVWYFEESGLVLWRGWCGTLKRWCGTLKRVVVLWRGWYGTLKRVVWYFEEVVWYFEEGCVVLWRGWYVTLKRVCYFKEGDYTIFSILLTGTNYVGVFAIFASFSVQLIEFIVSSSGHGHSHGILKSVLFQGVYFFN